MVHSEETPEVDDEDIEENEFETDSKNETDGKQTIGLKALAHIHQMAPFGATNFIKVNNQYSEVIFVVFYYFCFIDYKLKSKNPQLQAKPRSS